jgi:hypothetical protein
MSSIWAEIASKLMKEENSNGILIPIILNYNEESLKKSNMKSISGQTRR